mgnify:CR=1 FL=1
MTFKVWIFVNNVQVWAIAEGRGAAAAVDRYLAAHPAKNPEGTEETQGGVTPWEQYQSAGGLRRRELVA